jgi:cytochrome subunit of sulfide dehydrogenase
LPAIAADAALLGRQKEPMTATVRAAVTSLLVLATAAASAQDATLSRNLAAVCANCHGTNGHARGDILKPLAGVPAQTIVAAMADYRSGATPATVMQQIARGFSDDQIKAIAAYFAAQRPGP